MTTNKMLVDCLVRQTVQLGAIQLASLLCDLAERRKVTHNKVDAATEFPLP